MVGEYHTTRVELYRVAGPPVTLTTGPVWHFETSRLEGALPLLKIKKNVINSKLIVLVNFVKNIKRKKNIPP